MHETRFMLFYTLFQTATKQKYIQVNKLTLNVLPKKATTVLKQRDSLRLIEEELNDVVPAFRMVEEHKEGPVDEPGPLLE